MNSRHNILILEPISYSARALSIYRALGSVYFFPSFKKKTAREEILSKTTILVVRLAHKIDASWFDKMQNLKCIATPTTGLNHIDLEGARRRKIEVVSLRQIRKLDKIPSTAELTFGLLLALLRNIPWAYHDVISGNWNRTLWRGHELLGKTFGILGFGRLGKIVARYAHAFGMKVIAADPYISSISMARYGVKKVGMSQLFRKSDALSIHVLLDKKTAGLVKKSHLKQMKSSAVLVNTARGEIIQSGALFSALKNKWIAGAAVDVLWNESADGAHLFYDQLAGYAKSHSNLLITPHIGGATFEAMSATEDLIAEAVMKKYKLS